MLHKKLLAARKKKNDYRIEYKRCKEKNEDQEQEKNAKE